MLIQEREREKLWWWRCKGRTKQRKKAVNKKNVKAAKMMKNKGKNRPRPKPEVKCKNTRKIIDKGQPKEVESLKNFNKSKWNEGQADVKLRLRSKIKPWWRVQRLKEKTCYW